MWPFRKKSPFERAPSEPTPAPLFDPVLGAIHPGDNPETWQSSVCLGDQTVRFIIGGGSAPDPRLIEHTRDIVRTFSAFQEMISNFLTLQVWKEKYPELRKEIAALTIEDVCLFWPDRPDDGMISFKGPDEFKIWRCDYIDRKPVNLGFDD